MSSNRPPGRRTLDFAEKVSESFKRLRPHSGRPQSSDAGQSSTHNSENLGSSIVTPGAYDGSLDQFTNELPNPRSLQTDIVGGAWAGLVSALQSLEQSADLCPPIKPMISKLLGCIPAIDVSNLLSLIGCLSAQIYYKQHTRGRKEYSELASNLRIMLIDLAKHLRESQSPQMRLCVTNVVSGIEEELADINDKLTRRGLSRVRSSEEDLEHLDACYKKIQILSQQLQSNAALCTWSIAEGLQMDQRLERMKPAVLAQYNAGISSEFHRRKCTHNTRQVILKELHSWAKDPAGVKIYWMNGMAGTGKTTIAYTLCAELDDQYKLGASFFCSRKLPECRDVLNIVPTIAYQLAQFSVPFRSALAQNLVSDPDSSKRDIGTQLGRLIFNPLQSVKSIIPDGLIVVVIDALNECSDTTAANILVDALARVLTGLPIKIFVTCRPEHGLYSRIQSLDVTLRSVFHLHDIDQTVVQGDIETYLHAELNPIGVLDHDIKRLAERSGRLFIYAATVARYILPMNADSPIDPEERLQDMLSIGSGINSLTYEALDDLYANVMSTALENKQLKPSEAQIIRATLHTVVCVKEPLTIGALAALLRFADTETVMRALRPLHSVLHVSSKTQYVSVLHSSFTDYLFDPNRSGRRGFLCNVSQHSHSLALLCFEILKKSLRFNICNLESSFALDHEVSDIQNRVDKTIPLHLGYACKYWADHLFASSVTDDLTTELMGFLSHRLLFWMEVLSLKKHIESAADQLARVHQWVQKHNVCSQTCKIVHDAYRFAARTCAGQVVESTPHIYVSMLALCDRTSAIWDYYGPRVQGLARVEGTRLHSETGQSTCIAVWKISGFMNGTAMSFDGTRLAVGVYSDLWILDARTGAQLMDPFKGHRDGIRSVAFSPNGRQVASGSEDTSVRVWDVVSSNMVGNPFIWHEAAVQSVVFSPDGNRLVSASRDGIILIWDAKSHELLDLLCSDEVNVWSIAWSFDGRWIASGSTDAIVRIWDAHNTRAAPTLLVRHSNTIFCVAFSPDSSRIASASGDCTIVVWDTKSGDIVIGPLEQHYKMVATVAFSSDGKRIASGSLDKDIWIWDAESGEALAIHSQGYRDPVVSVIFSPDNACLVSRHSGGTICLWDTTSTVDSVDTPQIAPGYSACMKFLPGSNHIAIGCQDGNIRIWDAETDSVTVTCLPSIYAKCVTCLACTSDGQYLACGYLDGDVQVWDTSARNSAGLLFFAENEHGQKLSSPCSLAFSPDGACIIGVFDTGHLCAWDRRTGSMLNRSFGGVNKGCYSVSYISNTDGQVAFGYEPDKLYIWDAKGELWFPVTWKRPQSMLLTHSPQSKQNDGQVVLSFAPDGRRIASCPAGPEIYIWDTLSGDVLAGPMLGHSGIVRSLAFSSDGNRVASGSEKDDTVCIWNSQDGSLLFGPFTGHTDVIRSVSLSSDNRVASRSRDGTIRVWYMQDKQDTEDESASSSWSMDDCGWILDRHSRRLMWIPLDLQTHLKQQTNSALISDVGYFSLHFEGALLGDQWGNCYKE